MGWYEHLQKHEVPPEYLWEDGRGLEMWWATVEERRKDDPFGERTSRGSDSDDSPDQEMVENDYARAMKG